MATPSAKPHRGHSSSGASIAQFSPPRAISPSPKKLKSSSSAPESVKRTNFRRAAVTMTETNEAGTTAREMGSCLPERKGTHRGKSSPHLWTRPSVSAAHGYGGEGRSRPHSPISCPSRRNSSLMPSAHADPLFCSLHVLSSVRRRRLAPVSSTRPQDAAHPPARDMGRPSVGGVDRRDGAALLAGIQVPTQEHPENPIRWWTVTKNEMSTNHSRRTMDASVSIA